MADCAKVRALLSCYVDGELTEAEKNEIAGHLEGCADCRALLSVYQSLTDASEDDMVEPPEGFAAGVMKRIEALGERSDLPAFREIPENAAAPQQFARKTKKSYKPVIISFVAAAACFALVWIVSPQLFLGGNRSTSGAPLAQMQSTSESQASAAPYAAAPYGAPAPAAGSAQDASKKAAESGTGQGYTAASTPSPVSVPTASAAPSTAALPSTTALQSPMPSAAAMPSGAQINSAADGNTKAKELADYYAVITVSGQLPDFIASNVRTANGNGTYNIEITYEDASQLAGKGYSVQFGNPEKKTALVIYEPS